MVNCKFALGLLKSIEQYLERYLERQDYEDAIDLSENMGLLENARQDMAFIYRRQEAAEKWVDLKCLNLRAWFYMEGIYV